MSDLTPYRPPDAAGALVAWADAARAAHALATSLVTTQVCPDAFRDKPQEATAVILLGAELGMSPIAALRSMFVIRGQVGMYVRAQVALVQSRGHRIWTEAEDDERVIVAGHRAGDPDHIERVEWTIARARRAGLLRNAQYESQPRAMLWARAAGDVCRRIAADALAGVPEGVDEPIDRDAPGESRTVRRRALPAPGPDTVTGGDQTSGEAPVRAVTVPGTPDATGPERAPAGRSAESTRPGDTRETVDVDLPNDDTEPRITESQRALIQANFRALGIAGHDERTAYESDLLGRAVPSTNDLSVTEASVVIDALIAEVNDRRGERHP